MSACLDSIAVAPSVPAATPRTAGDCRVTCAVYSPSTIALTRVVAVKPSICAPAATGFVTVQVRLGVPGTSTGNTSGYATANEDAPRTTLAKSGAAAGLEDAGHLGGSFAVDTSDSS
jgi:hypothetical protein